MRLLATFGEEKTGKSGWPLLVGHWNEVGRRANQIDMNILVH